VIAYGHFVIVVSGVRRKFQGGQVSSQSCDVTNQL